MDVSKTVIWNNRTPQSIRFCKRLKFEFVKKSKDIILKEDDYVKNQKSKLMPCKIILKSGKSFI